MILAGEDVELLGVQLRGGQRRWVGVRTAPGHRPAIVVGRETASGTPAGEVRIFPRHFDVLEAAIEAVHAGVVGEEFTVETLRFETGTRGCLGVGLLRDGGPTGSTGWLLPVEVQALEEALVLARSSP